MTITASHATVIDGLRNDPIIQVMASRLTRIPYAELANEDGPLRDLVNTAHRTYTEKAAEAVDAAEVAARDAAEAETGETVLGAGTYDAGLKPTSLIGQAATATGEDEQ